MNSGGPTPGGARACRGKMSPSTILGNTSTAKGAADAMAADAMESSLDIAFSVADRVSVVIFSQQSVGRTCAVELGSSR